jgi:ABC-type dipeptide/oligopeptide/nickel transport system ATPase component
MPKPKITLPSQKKGSPEISFEDGRNVVVIGANGTGKSRLGAWIDEHAPLGQLVHRISAQRALDVPDSAPMKTLESSMNQVLFGHEESQYANRQFKLGHKWRGKPTTMLLNDYSTVLSLLFAKQTKRNSEYVEAARQSRLAGTKDALPIPPSSTDLMKELWLDIMPHRELILDDGKIIGRNSGGPDYRGAEMSDGERVAIYLLAQCICMPEDAVVIIDEPEIHLHRSIMKRLWDAVERTRRDCLFVYITHDLDFAGSRAGAFKLWVKAFDGKDQWDWEEAPSLDGFPEALQLELLGSRKPILFVEGERGSLDELIYSVVYPTWFIVPRGGCTKVIESVRGFKTNPALHTLRTAGIIDRDFRSEHELVALAADGIHGLAVAEIESLLCIDEFVQAVSETLARNPETDIASAREFVVTEFKKDIVGQVAKMSAAEVHFRLGLFDRNQPNLVEIKNAIAATTSAVDVDAIYAIYLKRATEAVAQNAFDAILRIYNRKGLHNQIGSQIFKLKSNEYYDLVLRLLKTDKRERMVAGLRRFCPVLAVSAV